MSAVRRSFQRSNNASISSTATILNKRRETCLKFLSLQASFGVHISSGICWGKTLAIKKAGEPKNAASNISHRLSKN